MNTTQAQNKAHRDDLSWVKVGRSEYMRSDGLVIRKSTKVRQWWQVFLPNGERPLHPKCSAGEGYFDSIPAAGHSLTAVKYLAQYITTDAPIYVHR